MILRPFYELCHVLGCYVELVNVFQSVLNAKFCSNQFQYNLINIRVVLLEGFLAITLLPFCLGLAGTFFCSLLLGLYLPFTII